MAFAGVVANALEAFNESRPHRATLCEHYGPCRSIGSWIALGFKDDGVTDE